MTKSLDGLNRLMIKYFRNSIQVCAGGGGVNSSKSPMQRQQIRRQIKTTARQRDQNRLQKQQQDQDQYQKKTQTDYEKEQIIIFSIFQSFRNDRGMKTRAI